MTTTKKPIPILLILLALTAFILSCTQLGTKPFQEWSPQEKAILFMDTYNVQYNDYQAAADRQNLSPVQKDMLRTKRSVLIEVYPLIQSYASVVRDGGAPSIETEQAILALLNRLEIMALDRAGGE